MRPATRNGCGCRNCAGRRCVEALRGADADRSVQASHDRWRHCLWIPDVITGPENEEGDGVVENDPEIQALVASLREHDETTPKDGEGAEALVQYHLKRAEICAKVGAKSKKLANREHWYKQVGDSLNAAVQTGKYPKGVATLNQYGEQFAKVAWGKSLAAYFLYRSINSDYAVKLAEAADPAELQKGFMKQLQDFLVQYPEHRILPIFFGSS